MFCKYLQAFPLSASYPTRCKLSHTVHCVGGLVLLGDFALVGVLACLKVAFTDVSYRVWQEEREMTMEQFKFRFGDEPKKDELTIFVPRQDDPTDTVSPKSLI